MMRRTWSTGLAPWLVAAAGWAGCCATLGAQAQFTGLGDLAGGRRQSMALGVSADGSVVCGISGSEAAGNGLGEAFIWTQAGGMIGLGDLPGGIYFSQANAISDDGAVVVGSASSANAIWPNTEGFRWTADTGMRGIGVMTGGAAAMSPVRGVSGDGRVLVGLAAPPGGGSTQGFMWTEDSGFTALGLLPGEGFGWAADVDFAGTLIVGYASDFRGQGPRQWTESGGWEPLFDGYGAALAVTPDGSVVAGRLVEGTSRSPLRWTRAGGPAGLPNADGTEQGAGSALSAGGEVVVGTAKLIGSGDQTAILWSREVGTVQIGEWLEESFDLSVPPGWVLEYATGVSADGRMIVGRGLNPEGDVEAWRVEAPWIRCPADWTLDGVLEPGDVAAFHRDYLGGSGDFNGDGVTNILDYLAFLNAYVAGC